MRTTRRLGTGSTLTLTSLDSLSSVSRTPEAGSTGAGAGARAEAGAGAGSEAEADAVVWLWLWLSCRGRKEVKTSAGIVASSLGSSSNLATISCGGGQRISVQKYVCIWAGASEVDE